MGVPGLTLQAAFFPGYGNYNPYYKRFATSTTASVITDAIRQQPTFFLLWLGDNDVLASALAGTDAMMTPADTFAKYYPMAVGALMASGKSPKGVLATIPDITSIPFFTTISKQLPYNAIVCDATQAAQLNFVYNAWGHPEIVWQAGPNPFVYSKDDGSFAQMGPEDLFLLTVPTDSIKCRLMGSVDTTVHPLPKPYPIPGKYILTKSEQDNLIARTAEFNEVITKSATDRGLALADMNSYMATFESGMVFDGIKVNLNFVTGGLFSTDGVHLCPRGNLVAANYILEAITKKYGSKIPKANVTDYPGLVFP